MNVVFHHKLEKTRRLAEWRKSAHHLQTERQTAKLLGRKSLLLKCLRVVVMYLKLKMEARDK